MNANAHHRKASRRGVRGFAVMSAIFLLVVLALLGTMIVALSTTQQVSQVRDLDGSRAYYAARAGAEWGIYKALHDGSCVASSTLPALGGSASGFTVTVLCGASGPYDEAGNSTTLYQVKSTATKGTIGQLNYVERQVVSMVSSR